MLTLPSKIFLCREPVNMRMSFEGLGTIVEQLFPGELLYPERLETWILTYAKTR